MENENTKKEGNEVLMALSEIKQLLQSLLEKMSETPAEAASPEEPKNPEETKADTSKIGAQGEKVVLPKDVSEDVHSNPQGSDNDKVHVAQKSDEVLKAGKVSPRPAVVNDVSPEAENESPAMKVAHSKMNFADVHKMARKFAPARRF